MEKREKIIGAAVFLGIAVLILILGQRFDEKDNYYDINDVISEHTVAVDEGEKELSGTESVSKEEYEETLLGSMSDEGKSIFVDIQGAVKKPGVYELEEGDRLKDLLDRCGGFTEDAYTFGVNGAEKVVDEGYYYIFTNQEIEDEDINVNIEIGGSNQNGSSGTESSTININSATKEALMTLPGIGEVKAESIIRYRETNGVFTSISDLEKVDGIGSKTVEQISQLVDIN